MNTHQATHTPGPTRFNVIATHRGQPMRIGIVQFSATQNGWRYFPLYQENASRKFWPTAEDAVKGRVRNFTLEAVSQTVVDGDTYETKSIICGTRDPVETNYPIGVVARATGGAS